LKADFSIPSYFKGIFLALTSLWAKSRTQYACLVAPEGSRKTHDFRSPTLTLEAFKRLLSLFMLAHCILFHHW